MKQIITLIFLLASVTAFSQNVVSQTRILMEGPEFICGFDTIETTYYIRQTTVTDNVAGGYDTSYTSLLLTVDGKCPADSAELAQYFYTQSQNEKLRISGNIGIGFGLFKANREERGLDTLYQSLTGESLQVAKRRNLYSEYGGEGNLYRVFTATGNFFAKIVVLPNGTWRLRQLTSPTGVWDGVNQWVVAPDTRNDFRINQIDLGYGATNYNFNIDLSRKDLTIFWPLGRFAGATGTARIVRIK